MDLVDVLFLRRQLTSHNILQINLLLLYVHRVVEDVGFRRLLQIPINLHFSLIIINFFDASVFVVVRDFQLQPLLITPLITLRGVVLAG